jgi:nitrate reductase beta subunit
MKIKAQMTMVLNLDKCLGCHTCSIPCKNVWTSRAGAEYMWFNNVETKPGIGYPKNWEDQGIYNGGWSAKDGKLSLAAGGRIQKLSRIFNNPDLPQIDAYYEPWDYDYGSLLTSPVKKHQPAIRPRSQITGKSMEIQWGPNWKTIWPGCVKPALRTPIFTAWMRRNTWNLSRLLCFTLLPQNSVGFCPCRP